MLENDLVAATALSGPEAIAKVAWLISMRAESGPFVMLRKYVFGVIFFIFSSAIRRSVDLPDWDIEIQIVDAILDFILKSRNLI